MSSAKLYSRSGAFTWSPAGIEKKGLIVSDFAQCFDPTAASLSSKIDFVSASDFLAKSQILPTSSFETNYKFNELAWSKLKSDAHPSGVIAGGTEDGTVVFFDAEKLIENSSLEVLSARKDHHGHVLTIDSSIDGRWMCSGGGSGQLLLWDVTNLASPFTPGPPNFQDQVKQLRWNLKTETIFASISSSRVSCWDMRRHGSPVLEFAEIGNSCDWSSLCWSPTDSSQLIVGSQSNHNAIIQKWDLRFTSTPLKEYFHHNTGTTSIDWNKKDSRLMVSSGCDGQVLFWDQNTGEVLGNAETYRGDWIRRVQWNEVNPSQLAIQYFQVPVQISSLSSLGAAQEGAPMLPVRISDNFVPAWCGAPNIGVSLAVGGRLATHWRSYDAYSQKWENNVEVETITTDPELTTEVQEFVTATENNSSLAWYIHDYAFKHDVTNEDAELIRLAWLLLVDQIDGKSRRKILCHLGFLEQVDSTKESSENPTSQTDQTNSRSEYSSTVRSSSIEPASWDELDEVFADRSINVNWASSDEKFWELMQCFIKNDNQKTIEILCASQKWMAAVQFAYQEDSASLMHMVFQEYRKANPEADDTTNLVMSLCSAKKASSPERVVNEWEECITNFPDDKWRILIGLLVSRENSERSMNSAALQMGKKWMYEGKPLRACLAFILAGDLESLMMANEKLPIEDRIKQGYVLMKTSSGSCSSVLFEKVVTQYGNGLLNRGFSLVAWKLLRGLKNVQTEELRELQFIVWSASGGRECTGDEGPKNPWVVEQPRFMQTNGTNNGNYYQSERRNTGHYDNNFSSYSGPYSQVQSQPPLLPPSYGSQPQNQNIAPMPPSSMFYQTPSWDHKPAPPMPSSMPPPKPSAPVSSGWNDPPPLVAKAPIVPHKPNVVQVNWKPLSTPAAPGGMMPNYGGQMMNNGMGYQQNYAAIERLADMTQGMRIDQRPPSVATSFNSSPASPVVTSAPTSIPDYHLSSDDEKIVQSIDDLAVFLINSATDFSRREKATQLQGRIKAELTPKLASNRLTPATRQQLLNIAYFTSAGNYREAQRNLGEMARNSADFVEISSFLPALKSLYSLALR